MTLLDLLFIAVVFTSVGALAAVSVSALLGRARLALKLLAVYGICLALYLGVEVAVSLASPQRVLALGEDRCFDDWCIAVDDVTRNDLPARTEYTVTLRLSSRARRVPQRENGIVVYIADESGGRFDAVADPSATPFNVLLQPGEAVTTTRTFDVAGAAGQPVLVMGHAGSRRFPGLFIIGDDSSLLHKRMIVRLP
jgi:hypothetical protein